MRAGKGLTLFFSNEDINDIIKIIKSLEDSDVLIDGITETVKHEIEKQEGGFLGALLASFKNIEITNYFNYEPRFNGVFFQETTYVE